MFMKMFMSWENAMQEHQRLARNQQRLTECYSVFAEALTGVIADMERSGFRPRIQEAWRSPEAQLAAVNNGNSELRFGYHNVTGADGRKEALAVDLLDDDAPLQPSRRYVLTLAAVARDHGLETGVLWGLQRPTRERLERAIRERDFDAPGKLGWDPCHVQVTGMTPARARQGERPTRESLRAVASEVPQPAVAASGAVRTLLVRSVSGPARSRVGEIATYRATSYNLPDPTQEETAGINWDVESGGATIAEFPAAGDRLDLEIAPELSGRTIRVRPFRNVPTNRVSVVTSVEPLAEVPDGVAIEGHVPPTTKVVSLEREGPRYFARIDHGPRFFVGSDVRFQGNRGLMNTSDVSGVPYRPADYRGRFGFWADFIYPTALCESGAFFQRLNTYDRARFTFGFFQLAAHTPNDNFVLFLRQLLTLPLASAYFPDLALHQGAVHRATAQGLVRLETDASTEALMDYLNPSRGVVDEREVINAAKFIHWSLNDPAFRDLQVTFTISQQKKRLAQYDRLYRLHGLVDTVCLAVADIRHQGRARSSHIIEALASQDALNNLLLIGEDAFRERLRTLRAALAAGEEEGTLGVRRYDAASNDFVLL
jgi:hypothetical protein